MTFFDAHQADDRSLSSREAFMVMTDFVWRWARTGGYDLVDLLGDTDLDNDGGPTDPAAWQEWIESVDKIKSGLPPREG